MSQNDIIIRTHYKSPHRLHIDSDIPTPSSEPINKFARQLITLLDTSDLSSMLSYCVTQEFTANCRKISQNCYSTALFTINFATSPIHTENILITLHYKKEIICQKLQLKPLDHVVEIGSGWGGFAIYAAQHYGCKVTTITISQAQYDEAVQRIQAAGLSHRVEVQLKDYRQLQGKFDKLVSIEMIEAVGEQFLPTYFKQCRALLKPQGLALIQAITIEDARYKKALDTVDYIKRYIFPGSFIPCISVLTQTASEQKLRLKQLEDIGQSYAQTIHHWRKNFLDAKAQVLALGFDENFIRMWDFYLCYCEGGFKEGVISDVHLLFEASAY